MKMEATQAECSVGWLNEVLVLFTVGLTLCQQLKDKINAFKMDVSRVAKLSMLSAFKSQFRIERIFSQLCLIQNGLSWRRQSSSWYQ